MSKIAFAPSLAACGVLALGVANAGTGKARTLMTKDLPAFQARKAWLK